MDIARLIIIFDINTVNTDFHTSLQFGNYYQHSYMLVLCGQTPSALRERVRDMAIEHFVALHRRVCCIPITTSKCLD